MKLSRRNFIKRSAVQSLGITSIPMLLSSAAQASVKKETGTPFFKDRGIVLFQGDSITDAGRDKANQKPNDARAFGYGYALMTAAALLAKMPEKQLTTYNRGISGNKVFQLADRWQADCLDLKPDVLSILIGVNDYWHKRRGKYDGTVKRYENDYRALLKRTKENLPDVKLVICEPYAIEGGSAIGEGWQEEFKPYREVAGKLSEEFSTIFIPYHTIFKKAIKQAPAEYWSPEGVHPTMAGARLMAQAWLEAVEI